MTCYEYLRKKNYGNKGCTQKGFFLVFLSYSPLPRCIPSLHQTKKNMADRVKTKKGSASPHNKKIRQSLIICEKIFLMGLSSVIPFLSYMYKSLFCFDPRTHKKEVKICLKKIYM